MLAKVGYEKNKKKKLFRLRHLPLAFVAETEM